jgi:hypothetical protein
LDLADCRLSLSSKRLKLPFLFRYLFFLLQFSVFSGNRLRSASNKIKELSKGGVINESFPICRRNEAFALDRLI